MRIVFFETQAHEKTFFSSKLPNHELIFFEEKLSGENSEKIKDADIVCVFINSTVDANVLESAHHLKGVVTQSTGIDHIDSQAAQQKNIQVLNVPHYGVNTVAEHTFALILALSRNIITSVEKTKRGNFSNEGLTGFDLSGKTLGVIGLGNIGRRVAEIGYSFHMTVVAYNRSLKSVPNVVQIALEELLQKADIITVHTPLTPETKHLINRSNIRYVKKGSFLINTARGPIIETEALVTLLQEKTLAGAALDVLEEEQAIKEERHLLSQEYIELSSAKTLLLDHVLLNFENVIITPHNAFNSKEALLEINEKTLQNILLIAKQ